MTDLAAQVRRRAAGLCEYCHIPEAAFRSPFHIEHILAKQHGGATQLDNLALACAACNLKKGPNLAGIDPETRQLTPLFNPRKDLWADHFALLPPTRFEVEILALTSVGRTTVKVLGINDHVRKRLRYELFIEDFGPS